MEPAEHCITFATEARVNHGLLVPQWAWRVQENPNPKQVASSTVTLQEASKFGRLALGCKNHEWNCGVL